MLLIVSGRNCGYLFITSWILHYYNVVKLCNCRLHSINCFWLEFKLRICFFFLCCILLIRITADGKSENNPGEILSQPLKHFHWFFSGLCFIPLASSIISSWQNNVSNSELFLKWQNKRENKLMTYMICWFLMFPVFPAQFLHWTRCTKTKKYASTQACVVKVIKLKVVNRFFLGT